MGRRGMYETVLGRRDVTARRKVAMFRQQGGRCIYCKRPMRLEFRGKPSDNPDHATVEHRNPVNLGGGNNDENVALSCWDCNSRKGNLTEEQFLACMAREKELKDRA